MKKNRGILYVTPWLIGLLVFTAFPFIASFLLSFTDYNLMSAPQFIGLQNYKTMFQDPIFKKSLVVTLKYVFMTVPFKLIFALFIAFLLNFKLKGVNLFRTAYYLPSILGGSVAVAVLWRYLFANNGVINMFLQAIGLDAIPWLNSPTYALITVSALRVWQFGSAMVIFLSALQSIPDYLYEAARIDGVGKMTQFFQITIPLISPTIFFNFIMQTIQAFQEFNGPYIITNGGPLNSTYLFPLYIYDNSFKFFKMGYASAMSWFLFVIIMIFTLIAFATEKYWVYYDGEDE